uniref:Putative bZIP transcription factor 39-like isoform X2 n=1 Tax=Cymbidium ensifolium TaxID=78740 RepID=A0A5C1YU05_CYMEN|nr:putative bZIP transcription factor 39-like isoform X2 [Cymbidium ensifolium]
MAEHVAADPFSPPIGLSSDPNFFDPHLFPDDLYLPGGGLSSEINLDFDFDGIDWDISVDDLLLPEDTKPPSHPTHTSNDGSQPESGVVTSSSSPGTSGIINISSPESDRSANCSTESSANVKQDENNGWGTKMMKKRGVGSGKSNINPRSSKSRRSEDFGSCAFNATNEEVEKMKARLMRNRESAQLSRQRKKEYVQELEEKVRSMSSTIAELNGKISFIMAENMSLKQQLSGSGGSGFPPGVYPSPSFGSMHFPWAPYPALAFRQQGSPVPLVPIPKLKSQQAVASQTKVKTEKTKRESKIRKVASITLLGFLFFVLIFGGLIRRVDHIFEESRNFGAVTVKNGLLDNPNGMVLSVSGRTRSVTSFDKVGFNNGRNSKGDYNSFQDGKLGSEDKSWPSDGRMIIQNSSESLPALLYVPRNGKHVEIDGNLIINSVLASEKAVAQVKPRDWSKHPSGDDGIETGLVIANLDSGVALSARDIGGHTKTYGSSTEYQRALASDSEDAFMDKSQDGLLQQWFREGMAGPIFSSGTCTEVFQFQISPSSASPNAVITTPSRINATETAISNSNTSNTSSSSAHQSVIKNRRFLHHQAIPLPGSTVNHTEHRGKGSEGSSFQRNSSEPPMVVSVLIDPREVGDGDGDGMISPKKSLQRIFVVILLDSVKYVTYSCVLPIKGHSHLVN